MMIKVSMHEREKQYPTRAATCIDESRAQCSATDSTAYCASRSASTAVRAKVRSVHSVCVRVCVLIMIEYEG
jgi:hypothetical protein